MAIVVDTHTAIWYLLRSNQLSSAASQAIHDATSTGSPIYVPVISLVEVVYLAERGRLPKTALERLLRALKSDDSALKVVSLDSEIAEALQQIPRAVVPDMPDRIIAATAFHLDLPLVTRDRRIQSAGIRTIW